jgi:Tol biopolymer transport system component
MSSPQRKHRRITELGYAWPIELRSARRLGVLAGLLLLALAILDAPPASAVQTRLFKSSFEIPRENHRSEFVSAADVNMSTHHIYVALGEEGVDNFDPNGQLDPVNPHLTGSTVGSYSLAVDNSGGAHEGYIYAGGFRDQAVQQYDPAGAATSVVITKSSIPPDGTPQAGGLPPVVNTGTLKARALAVDSAGNVFVTDTGENNSESIYEFSPSGVFIAQMAVGLVPDVERISFAPNGNLYVGASLALDPAGSCVNACAPITPDLARSVAITASGNLLTLFESESKESLNEYDASGNLLTRSGRGRIVAGRAVTVDWTNETAYLAAEGLVYVFGSVVNLADPATGDATALTSETATLNGTVNPSGVPVTECFFEYGETASYGHVAQCESPDAAGIGSGAAPVAVHANVIGLTTGTGYHFRLVIANAVAPSEPQGADQTFMTAGPQIHYEAFSAPTLNSATLEARVNPAGRETSYRFEYVTATAFEEHGYADAAAVPVGGESLGSGTSDVTVAQQIAELSPGTTYHFRVIAESPDGTATGADSSFTTYLSEPSFSGCTNQALRIGFAALLPDCRAYEQATPVEKNGTSAWGLENLIQASVDGDKSTFYAESGMPGGEGAQEYPLFLASRAPGGSGWSTQGLMPPASLGPVGFVLGWSEDLSYAYVEGGNSGSQGHHAIYQRDSSDHSLKEIAPSTSNHFAAATASGSAMVFESPSRLTSGSAQGQNVYLWNRAAEKITLASVLNNGKAPPNGAFAGAYAWANSNPMSGGANVGNATEQEHVLSSDGEGLYFTASGTGKIYLRRNLGQPQSPRDGQEHCTVAADACTIEISASRRQTPDPNGPQLAAFRQATPDGRFAFFTSPGALTDDATTSPLDRGNDLYRYDAATETLIDLVPDQVDPNGAEVMGLFGADDAGSTVYFTASGVLAGNAGAAGTHASRVNCKQPSGSCNLYRWSADGSTTGQVTFIARLNSSTDGVAGAALPGSAPVERSEGVTNRVTPDGKTVLFYSTEKLGPFNNRGFGELYRYSAATGAATCVSCDPTNVPPIGGASLRSIDTLYNLTKAFPIVTRNLSQNGNRVFFESPDPLVHADTNGQGGCPRINGRVSCLDVYEWEARGEGSCESEAQNGGCIYLLSSGKSSEPSYFADASAGGDDAFIFTSQSLVNQDQDQLFDLYDVRVGGGIAAQNPAPPNPCSGEEACRPPVGNAPALPTPGSATFSGPGNPKPKHRPHRPKHHRKKRHQKHHKRKSQKKHRQTSRAHGHGRAAG